MYTEIYAYQAVIKPNTVQWKIILFIFFNIKTQIIPESRNEDAVRSSGKHQIEREERERGHRERESARAKREQGQRKRAMRANGEEGRELRRPKDILGYNEDILSSL